MALCCKNCGHEIETAGRIPPWCSHCGADVPREPVKTETAAEELAGARSHTAPANLPENVRPIEEKAHPSEPMRFQLAWHEPAAFRRALQPTRRAVRWIRNSLLAIFLMAGLGMAAIYGFGELFLDPLPLIITETLGTGFLCLIGIPLVILLAVRALSCYVTIGPQGVSRIQSIPMGHHVMVHRWGFPWKEIEGLLYIEDCPLGGRGWRILIVQSVTGEKEIIALADDVTRDQLAEVVAAWGKRLEEISEPRRTRLADELASVQGEAEPAPR